MKRWCKISIAKVVVMVGVLNGLVMQQALYAASVMMEQAILNISEEEKVRSPREPEPAGVENPLYAPEQGQAVCCPIPRDVNIIGDLFVGGDLTVDGTIFFNNPAGCSNVLTVKEGTLHSPLEFNSIKDAVDSITTNSSMNPFVVKVCPGYYIEDTITLKPFVAIITDVQGTVIVQVDDPSKNLLAMSPFSVLQGLQLQGATDTGSAAIVFSGGLGGCLIRECIFGSNDILINQTATVAPFSIISMEVCSILASANFTTGIKVAAPGVIPGIFRGFGFGWLRTAAVGLDALFDVSGPSAKFLLQSASVGGLALLPGTGLRVQDGSMVNLKTSTFRGFATAIDVPNVGAGPDLQILETIANFCTNDITISNPFTIAAITGVFDKDSLSIDPSANVAMLILDSMNDDVVVIGQQFVGNIASQITNISPAIQQGATLGVIEGGVISDGGGLNVTTSAGTGYLMVGLSPNDYLQYTTWNMQTIPLPADSDNYIWVDNAGVLQSALSEPNPLTTISLGKARTQGASITFLQEQPEDATHLASDLDFTLRNGLGPIYESGSIVSRNSVANVQLDVSNGKYFFGSLNYSPMGGAAITWNSFYQTGGGLNVINAVTNVDYQNYNNAGVLTPIPANQFARHAFYVANDGVTETYMLVYGQVVYPTLILAQNGTIPPEPGTWNGNIALIASIIVENTAVVADQIAEIRDERPRLGFKPSGVSVVTNHGDLTGLLADDHPQYLLDNGTRAMSGDLNMGGNSIINVNLVDGVDVPAHASRHLPNGADPLTTATPVTISTANSIGIANSFARSDHVHAHGNQPGGSLHADATTLIAGFMSAADKAKLDGFTPGDYVLKTGDTMTGDLVMANQKEVRLSELSINGTDFVGLRAPASLLSSYQLTFPINAGSSGQVLTTNGSGVLSWTSITPGGDINDGGNSFGAPITIGTNDNFALNLETNGTNRILISNTGKVTVADLATAGVVQTDGTGLLSSTNGSNGQLLIGGGVAPAWANLTSTGGTIAITSGANSINLDTSGTIASSFVTGSGTATPSAGVLNVPNGSNINTTGAGNVLTINLVDSPSVSGSLTAGTTVTAGTGITSTAGNITATAGSLLAPSGTLQVSAGTAASPSIRFTGSLTTGLSVPSINTLVLSTAGTNRLQISNTGATTISALGIGVVQSSGVGLLSSSAGANGQLLIGAGVGSFPIWAHLTSAGGTVAITNGAGTINLETSGSTANSFQAGSGTATPSAGVLNVPNGSNINTTGAGSTLTINLVNSPSVSGSLTAGTGVTSTTGNITATAGNLVAASGTLQVSAGTAAAPSIKFTGSLTTGLSVPSADTLVLGTAGTNRLQISNTGATTISALGVGVVQASSAGLLSSSAGANGQLLIGAGVSAAPVWANLASSGGTVVITNGSGTINLETSGSTANSFVTGSGTATPSAGVLTVPNGSNINTTGAGSTLTINLVNSPSVSGTVTAGTGITSTTGNILAASGAIQGVAGSGNAGSFTGGSSATAVTVAAGTGQTALAITGSTATAETIIAGTNSIGLSVAGNGTAHAASISAGNGTGGALLLTGGTGSGIPLQVTASAGTGNAATFTGNTSSNAVLMTAGAGRSALQLSAGTAAIPALVFAGSTTTGFSVPSADTLVLSTAGTNRLQISNTGATTISALGVGVVQASSAGLLSSSAGANGQLLIGAGVGAAPVWANLTSAGGTIAITNGAGTINLETSGATANSFLTGSGIATPAAGVLTVPNGSNINTTGAGSTLTINLVNSPSVSGTLTAGTGITSTTGNIVATAGQVNAGTTMTAGTGITATTGNIVASSGALQATSATNTTGLVVTGNGTANAATITAGNGTGGGLLITGGTGAGVPLQVTAAAGTGGAATITGNTSSTAMTITAGAGQRSLQLSAGTAAIPSLVFAGSTTTGISSPAVDNITLSTAGASRLNIDASGNTTYTSNYKVNAYLGANQTITGAGTQTIQFNTESFDPNNNFNTGTFLYTAPVTGFYLVSVNISATYSNNNQRNIELLRNGATVTGYAIQTSGGNNQAIATNLTSIINLTAGQTLGAQMVNTGGNVTMLANQSSISIHFMSI